MSSKRSKKRARKGNAEIGAPSASQFGLLDRFYKFFSIVEELPYGASLMQEKKIARFAIGSGVLLMAAGASIFAIGWSFKINWIVEVAFVITLIAWMELVVSTAFWFVSSVARKVPLKIRKH